MFYIKQKEVAEAEEIGQQMMKVLIKFLQINVATRWFICRDRLVRIVNFLIHSLCIKSKELITGLGLKSDALRRGGEGTVHYYSYGIFN